VGEEEWSYEWEELTEDVKDTVRKVRKFNG